MTTYVNLRGEPIDMANWRDREGQRVRLLRAAGVAVGRRPTAKRGHAAPPGTGPTGETCRGCAHKHSMVSQGGTKRWIKCDLRRATWTSGPGTDILASSPACSKFQPIEAAMQNNLAQQPASKDPP